MFWLNYMIVMIRLTVGLGLQTVTGSAEGTGEVMDSQTAYYFAGWVDEEHFVCYDDGGPVMVHLEKNEIEEIRNDEDDYEARGCRYEMKGDQLVAARLGKDCYRWNTFIENGDLIMIKAFGDYSLIRDCCGMDEFADMDYYLFCNTQLHRDAGDFVSCPAIVGSQTQSMEEAKALYQAFKERLPLESEQSYEEKIKTEEGLMPWDGEDVTEVFYISPDCKWIKTNKWSKFKNISTQRLFYEKEQVEERVSENGVIYPFLLVRDGEGYREMEKAAYEKLLYLETGGFLGNRATINAEGTLAAGIRNWERITIREIESEEEIWSFALQGLQEETRKIRGDTQKSGSVDYVWLLQFEGNAQEGWMIVQIGDSSFFRVDYPSGEATYLGEYMYSVCFSPDGKYAAYSDVDYDNGVGMEPEEAEKCPPDGIYIKEIETGKTAYIPWYYDMFACDFMEYRGFMWIEKEGFEEYMND